MATMPHSMPSPQHCTDRRRNTVQPVHPRGMSFRTFTDYMKIVISPLQVGRIAVEVVRNRAVVDATPADEGLDVVLRDVLRDADRAEDALAVVCSSAGPSMLGFGTMQGSEDAQKTPKLWGTPQQHNALDC